MIRENVGTIQGRYSITRTFRGQASNPSRATSNVFCGLPLKVLSRMDNKLDAAWQPAKCSLWLTVRFVFLAGGEVGLVKSSGHVRAAVRTAESRLWQIANPFRSEERRVGKESRTR